MAIKKNALSANAKPVGATERGGSVVDRQLTTEMKESYLAYAMSVIVSRALPDVRDGLKPVHRRILYAMWSLGLKSNAKFRKSATVVGEVLGKYHPHGDTAVYDSLVRMAQDFSLRYPLVRGQGNFGSMDGDGAAAMRYTEAKMSAISEELLFDIDKETVPFVPNYDASQKEPTVLPAALPNLLVNGTSGIAVGMATNIPPHNLHEVCDAAMHLLDNPKATVDDLLEHVAGPDFPTGGIAYDKAAIRQAYATGKGAVVARGKADIVEEGSGFRILITEIPYQVNKATLLTKIADLVRDKKLDGIRDLRDESGKEGVRIVVELKRDAFPKKVLNRLYKLTQLQDTFHYNMVALVDGIQPRVLTLFDMLEQYLGHRKEMVRRRTEYDLKKAEARAHILEGLHMALAKIDAVIKTIKQSKDRDIARTNLMKKFTLSEPQSIAILEMKLQTLANLERLKIETELKEKRQLIKDLKTILGSEKKIADIVKLSLRELKDKYGDERRTKIMAGAVDSFKAEDLIPKESTVVMITRDGYIKRLSPDTFKNQGRGGKGVIGLTTKEEDMVEHFFTTTTHSDVFFFTNRGRVFQLKAYDIPVASRTAKGHAVVNFLQLAAGEAVSAVLPLDDLQDYTQLVMVTQKGVIKKTDIKEFEKVRRSGLITITLKDGDALEWVKPSTGKDEIMLVTASGQAIRFKESVVRAMGRTAAGVRGIRLKGDDKIVAMTVIDGGMKAELCQLLVVMENGYGKRSDLKNYKVQGRGGSGIKTANITDKTGHIVAANIVNKKLADDDMVIISNKGQVIRMAIKTVSVLGRATQGVRLMRFKEKDDGVANVTFV